MLEQRVYSPAEITEIIHFAHQVDNAQAAIEASDHLQYFGKTVIVTKGRQVPIGTIGTVFWLARKHFGSNSWVGWQTRIGIREDDGTVHFLSIENVAMVRKEESK
ncbi:MAG: hypothetical protein PHP22_07985 [Oscillospiraceae bacterium]|nr:hypothetical protein [Oscillospiraceae bacterium]